MKIQVRPPQQAIPRSLPAAPAPAPVDLVEMRTERFPQIWQGVKGTGLAAAGGSLNAYLATTSPALIPLGVAASWVLSKGVDGAQNSHQRWVFMAGSLACAAAAVAMPHWSSAVVAGQAVLQGLFSASSVRPLITPNIPVSRLKEELLAANPEYADANLLLQQMKLPDLLQQLEQIYRKEVRPEHLQASQTLESLRRPDQDAHAEVERLLQQPFPGRVYTYRQRFMEDSPGVAGGAELGLSHEFLSESDKVSKWYVVGHEHSHIRHADVLLGLAADSLLHLTEERYQPEDVERAMTPHLHARELRADRDGADLATRHGASPAEILGAVDKLLGDTPRGFSHPSGYERLQALKRHLATG